KSISNIKSGTTQAGQSIMQLGSNINQLLRLNQAFQLLKSTISQVYKYAKQLEDTTVQFSLKLDNDPVATQEFVSQLRDFANSIPLLLTDVTNAANLLANYGIEMDQVVDKVKQLGDLSRG